MAISFVCRGTYKIKVNGQVSYVEAATMVEAGRKAYGFLASAWAAA